MLRRLTSGLRIPFAILALSLVALRPILGSQLTCADDNALHLLRLTQIDHLMRQGILFSRWAPDMALGYGYPFFNFYAPLSYYIAEIVSWFAQNLNLGMRLTFALGLYASGLAAYRLARDHFSPPASLAAAVAYVYAPYQAYDILFRGNLAESLAWPMMPIALWAMGRLARTGLKRWLALTGISYAAVLLTHNVFALIFSPLLALYGLSEALGRHRQPSGSNQPSSSSRLGQVLLSLGLGLGLAAFFWLPAALEQQYVHIEQLFTPSHFVYHENFIGLDEILAPPQATHPDLINPSPPRALGLVPVLIGLPGFLLVWRQNGSRRRQMIFFGSATAAYVFMMSPVSRPVWDLLPLVKFIQFPWRLLGPAALALAMLSAASVDGLLGLNPREANTGSSTRRLGLALGLPVVLCGGLILADLFWLDARYCPGLEEPSVASIRAYEEATGLIGTTAAGEYLPLTTQYLPDRPATTPFAPPPAGVDLVAVERKPLRFEAKVAAAEPFTVTANVLTYPGWRATIDGEDVPIQPAAGTGLITLSVPPGEHDVQIRFGNTPTRLVANIVTLLSGGVILFMLWRGHSWSIAASDATQRPGSAPLAIYSALGIGMFLFVAVVLPRIESPLRHLARSDMVASAEYGNGLILLNQDSDLRVTPADQPLRYDLYWTSTVPLTSNYQATLQMVDAEGQLWSPKGTGRPRSFRPPIDSSAWQPDQLAHDAHLLTPLLGTPPGVYDVRLILFDRSSLVAVPLLTGELSLTLGRVEVTRPTAPETVASLQPQYSADLSWEPQAPLQLVGYALDRREARPGDPVSITLFWHASGSPNQDFQARLILAGPTPEDSASLIRDFPLASATFPVTKWQTGDVWRGQTRFRLPADLAGGSHQWHLQLCAESEECLAETADLGSLSVTMPDRIFTRPQFDTAIGAQYGEVANLLGANSVWQGNQLDITLVWQATTLMDTSYRVFVHLIDENGQIVSQSDGEPANWRRPTTGWIPAEFVIDEHQLPFPGDLPSGSYAIRVGLYDEATGQRLPVGSADHVTIPLPDR